MSGLEKMLNEIRSEADTKAASILEQAEREASMILSGAKRRVESETKRMYEKADRDLLAIDERRDDQIAFQKNRAVLSGKQDAIGIVIKKTREYFRSLRGGDYESAVIAVFRKHLPKKDASIRFNENDRPLLSGKVFGKMKEEAAKNGVNLTLGERPAMIANGFLIDYGGIEENCSFDAIIDERLTEFQDLAAKTLFQKRETE